MDLLRVYRRALGLLGPEWRTAVALAVCNVGLAIVALVEPVLLGRVVDALTRGGAAFPLIALWASLGLVGIAAGVVVSTFADRLAHRRRLGVMTEAFERALMLPPAYHAERGSGAAASTIDWGTESLFWLWLKALREQLVALVSILLLVPTAIGMEPRLAVVLVALAGVYLWLNMLVIARTSEGQHRAERLRRDVSSRLVDVMGNVMVVQSFTRFADEAADMRRLTGRLLDTQYPVLTWWAVLSVLQRAAATIAMVAVFALGAVLAERGEISVGEIVSFVGFASLLITRLDAVSGFFTSLHQSAPALRAFFGLLDESPAIADVGHAVPLSLSSGEIRYENVTFTYPATNQGVFDVSLSAGAGETLAVVGPTGSGKSTLVSLLQRLRAPDAGRILIDGQDISEVTLVSLRRAIAVVFQDAHLFNRSIADNIRVGRPDATDEDVQRAARLAEAHEFIGSKPGGYDFLIGERGAALSGGERQRVAIARAILKDAPVLILDEATSALDNETEARIKRALDRLRKGRTTFIIAHRLSTVADADRIVVLDRGRIVEVGTYDGLVAARGAFARLVAAGGLSVTEPEGGHGSRKVPAH